MWDSNPRPPDFVPAALTTRLWRPILKSMMGPNDLDICQGFPDIMHMEILNGHKSAILNLIELKLFYGTGINPNLTLHILFCSTVPQ